MLRAFVGFAVMGLTLLSSAQADSFVVAADPWCPYTCDKANPHGPGVLIEVAERALKRMGETADYRVLSWSRAISEARSGNIFAIAGAFKEDAPDFIFPEVSQAESLNCFYQLKGSSWKYHGIQSLVHQRVGLAQGYSYGQELDAFFETVDGKGVAKRVAGDNPLLLNLEKLKRGRIDSILEDQRVLQSMAHEMHISVESRGCISPKRVYVAISPKAKRGREAAQAIAVLTRELTQSGEMERLFKKYAP